VDETFLASVFATPPVILGKQLLPFSCAHASFLYAIESPYMIGGSLTPDEICIAIWICSLKFEEIQCRIGKDVNVVSSEFKEWVSSFLGVHKINDANESFQQYLEQHLRAPERWKKKESKPSKSPWPLTIATNLMRELKFSEEKAWNLSMPLALWYFAAIAEANGDESLITEQEKEAAEKLRSMEATNGNI
jgi:hypothetical protein